MRTTLALDDDVLERARAVAGQLKLPFKTVVNEALRHGLRSREARQEAAVPNDPSRNGPQEGYNLDNIPELLAQLEGEDYR